MNLKNLKAKDVRKALVAVATVLAQLLALGLLPAEVRPYVVAVLGVLNAVGVYAVRNGDKPAETPEAETPAAPAA